MPPLSSGSSRINLVTAAEAHGVSSISGHNCSSGCHSARSKIPVSSFHAVQFSGAMSLNSRKPRLTLATPSLLISAGWEGHSVIRSSRPGSKALEAGRLLRTWQDKDAQPTVLSKSQKACSALLSLGIFAGKLWPTRMNGMLCIPRESRDVHGCHSILAWHLVSHPTWP